MPRSRTDWAEELHRSAAGLDASSEARRAVLGRIEARLSEREPDRERATARAVRPAEQPAGGVAAASIVVTVQREEQPEGTRTVAAGEGSERQPVELGKPPERDWTDERVFTVRSRIPTGAEQLQRAQLSPEEIAHVVQRAVDRAYPFLEREGVRGNFLCSHHGKALDVRLLIPEKLGWTHDQLRSPAFEQRLITGFHQALAQIAPARLTPEKQPLLPGHRAWLRPPRARHRTFSAKPSRIRSARRSRPRSRPLPGCRKPCRSHSG